MARTAWVPTNRAPRRLTSTTRRRESSVSAHGGVRLRTPALLTSPSTAPYSFRHLATSSPAQSQSATEPADANACPPDSAISAATFSAPSASMSFTTTEAPCWAASMANARPNPRPAPVTMTALPSSTPISGPPSAVVVDANGLTGAEAGRLLDGLPPLRRRRLVEDDDEEVVVALVEHLRSPRQTVPRTQAPAPIDADPHRHPYHLTGSSATPYTELSCLNRISSWGTASSSPGNRAKSRA